MRSKWKGIYIHSVLYKFANTKFKNFGENWFKQRINLRSSVFIKKFISRSMYIHNGLCLVNFKTYNHGYIGLKMGSFTYNRLIPIHSLINANRIYLRRKILLQHNKIKFKNRRPKWKNLKNIIK